MKKIELDYLNEINKTENINNYLGEWIHNLDEISNQFINAKPFEHVIIPNFLNEEYANKISNKFPTNLNEWHKYCNPLEVKYAFDDINSLDNDIKKVFYILSSEQVIEKVSKITNISNLTYDNYLHGAGLHAHPRYGRLNMHLDYEKHPYTSLQRRLNIILYMNKEWETSWNGATELWDEKMENCVVKSEIKFNTAIMFKTNEISWHGVPEKIMCPENVYRKSIAYYYLSPLENKSDVNKIGNDGSGYRTKATFIKRPQDVNDERMEKLYKIRPYRRIEKEDMNEIWPDWEITY
jgi:Rps23 Pro-64 3,4-dihydroxylase Tpa1-like proline 4-hydroxylase